MTKEEFKAVEKKLYDFYQRENIINSLKFKIDIIQEQIEAIEEKITGTKININDDGLQAVNYDERVQSTSTGISYAEKAAINQIESLEKESIRKKEIKNKLEENIRDIELEASILEYNINQLSKHKFELLKIKYGECKKDWQVGQKLNLEQSTVTRKRKKLIEEIARWERVLELMH